MSKTQMNIQIDERIQKQEDREEVGFLRREMQVEEALEGARIIDRFYDKLGLRKPDGKEEIDYRALREEAFEERLQTRNTL